MVVSITATVPNIGNVDLSKSLALIATAAMKHIDNRFEREGPGWAPLAPSTLMRRRKGRASFSGSGNKKLQDSGLMRESFRGGRGHVSRKTASSIEVGTSVFYAEHHQTGTRRMPAREIIVVDAELERAVEKAVMAGIKWDVK